MLGGMKRRRILLLFALAAVAIAAGFVLFSPRGPKEPIYEGKKLSYYIQEARGIADLGSKSLAVQRQNAGRNAINSIGTNAVPWLMSEFTGSEPKWRSAFNRWVSAHSSIGFRFRDRQDRLMNAAFGLAFLGTNAAAALPTLAAYLGDGQSGYWASIAIGGAGEMALPYLLPALTSTSRTERRSAGNGLGSAVHQSDAAIPVVVQLTQHSNLQVRLIALMALGNAKGRSDLLIPVYQEALSSADPSTLRVAAYAVGHKGEVTKAVIPDLLRLMTNSDPSVVRASSNTLFRFDRSLLPPRVP
jgi:hypothetical protein